MPGGKDKHICMETVYVCCVISGKGKCAGNDRLRELQNALIRIILREKDIYLEKKHMIFNRKLILCSQWSIIFVISWMLFLKKSVLCSQTLFKIFIQDTYNCVLSIRQFFRQILMLK